MGRSREYEGFPLPERYPLDRTFLTFTNDEIVYVSVVIFRRSLYFLVFLYRNGFLVLLEGHQLVFLYLYILYPLLLKFYQENSFESLDVLLCLFVKSL